MCHARITRESFSSKACSCFFQKMNFFEQLKKDLPAGIRTAKQYEKGKAVNVWDSGAALHKQEQPAQFENINIRH